MRALCFGEMLWDVNGDARTLGGAPLNVAGHIARLGGESLMVSAVGRDEPGTAALQSLDSLGIDRRYVHLSGYDTGYASVTLSDGMPSYAFNDPAAWDDIALSGDELSELSSIRFDAVVYGTLASRHERTRSMLFSILDRVEARERFFDVNIRLSFYSDELIRDGLGRATILKMNDEEIPVVARAVGAGGSSVMADIFSSFPGLRRIIVTRGGEGSECHSRDGSCVYAGAGNARVVSTVGAGDSLSAAFLYLSALGYDTGEALSRASVLASYVVAHDAAIPEYSPSLKEMLCTP